MNFKITHASLFLIALIFQEGGHPIENGFEKLSLLRTSCGPRAAWVFSDSLGFDFDQGQLVAKFGERPTGVSLAELCSHLTASGVSCELRQLGPTDLSHAILPALVHFRPENKLAPYGHYLVVVDLDRNGVTVVEPIVGIKKHLNWHFFSDRWSGNCIIPSPKPLWGKICNSWMTVLLLGGGNLLWAIHCVCFRPSGRGISENRLE